MKVNRHGQATIFTEADYLRFRSYVTSKSHRLIFDIAWWTGERMGAILQLTVDSVYENPVTRQPREYLTYPASTRKDGKTRQIKIHPELATLLWAYSPPTEGFLFQRIRHPGQALTMRDISKLLEVYLERCGWAERGYATHSFRRSFITRLHQKGIDPIVIQQLTGHASLQNLMKYIEVDPKRVDRALLSL